MYRFHTNDTFKHLKKTNRKNEAVALQDKRLCHSPALSSPASSALQQMRMYNCTKCDLFYIQQQQREPKNKEKITACFSSVTLRSSIKLDLQNALISAFLAKQRCTWGWCEWTPLLLLRSVHLEKNTQPTQIYFAADGEWSVKIQEWCLRSN